MCKPEMGVDFLSSLALHFCLHRQGLSPKWKLTDSARLLAQGASGIFLSLPSLPSAVVIGVYHYTQLITWELGF